MLACPGLVAEASNSLSAKQCLEKMAEAVGEGKVLKTSLKRSRGFPEVTWLLRRVQPVPSDPRLMTPTQVVLVYSQQIPCVRQLGMPTFVNKSSHLQIGV